MIETVIRFLVGWFILSIVVCLFLGRLFAIQKEGDRTALRDLTEREFKKVNEYEIHRRRSF